jgi:hypothetical protein
MDNLPFDLNAGNHRKTLELTAYSLWLYFVPISYLLLAIGYLLFAIGHQPS